MTQKKEIEKLFYSIGEVSNILKVNVSLIRFWEKEFDNLKPRKNKKGNRLFTKKDLDSLKLIFFLVKEKGFTIKGAKKVLKNNKTHLEENIVLKDKLTEIKDFLISLRSSL